MYTIHKVSLVALARVFQEHAHCQPDADRTTLLYLALDIADLGLSKAERNLFLGACGFPDWQKLMGDSND
jgi:hypothetical protein